MVNNACTVGCHHLNGDFCASLLEVEARKIEDNCSIIRRRIHSTGTDLAMAQPQKDQGSFDEDILDYIPEELIKQPHNSFDHHSGFVAANEASMPLSAVLPVGRSAITSRNQPIPCGDCNSNDITNNTNISSIVNMDLVNGSMIVDWAMWLGG